MKKAKMRRIIRNSLKKFGDDGAIRVLDAMRQGGEKLRGFNAAWAGDHRGRKRCVSMLDRAIEQAETRFVASVFKRSETGKRERRRVAMVEASKAARKASGA